MLFAIQILCIVFVTSRSQLSHITNMLLWFKTLKIFFTFIGSFLLLISFVRKYLHRLLDKVWCFLYLGFHNSHISSVRLTRPPLNRHCGNLIMWIVVFSFYFSFYAFLFLISLIFFFLYKSIFISSTLHNNNLLINPWKII